MGQILNTLGRMIKDKYVNFDPNNPKHLEAFRMLRYDGRQHPELRFHLEEPYNDVVTMMLTKISEQHCKNLIPDANFKLVGYR